MAASPSIGDRMSQQDHDEAKPLEDMIREQLPEPRAGLALPVEPEREGRFLRLLEGMEGFILEFDVDGHVVYASPGSERIIGYTADECLETNCIEIHPADSAKVIELGTRVRTTGVPSQNQTRVRHRDGYWVWIETTLLGWFSEDGGGYHTITFNRDISALKQAEEAQLESDIRYEVISHMSRDLVVEVDEAGTPSYYGPGSDDIWGYSTQELVDHGWSLMHPDDVPRVRDQLAAEFRDAASQSSGAPRLMEFRSRHRDGHWLHLETVGRVYRRSDDEQRFLAVCRDVTERRLAEQAQRDLEESMRRAQKLESLGVLAGGIAHDFNNLLTPILGAAGLARDELPEGSPVLARLETITRAARRAAALTDQMLAYAGQRSLRVDRVDLSSLVREIRDLTASSISGKTSFELDLAEDLPKVEGETAQLSQVVLNLVTNASESMADGVGQVTVRTGVVQIDEAPRGALFAETMQPGPHVFFEVADAGAGMDPETAARIFDPFFTTKFTGRGLGLAAVAGIVRSHHGSIEVESAEGAGTRFRVLLPVATDEPEERAPNAAPGTDTPMSGLALVIDDDPDVRELAAATLRRAGLSPLCAADGHEGVKLFSEHRQDIRVVLLDRTMPSLSGADTVEAIRELRADVPVVLISGYSEERVTAELAELQITAFVQKPFLPETLIARVREALESASD